jgi:hypothetical protein
MAYTLNHIWLQDHGVKAIPYLGQKKEEIQMPMVAED